MSLHINRFIDRLKAAESRQQRDFPMTVAEARDLHADITKLLLAIQVLQEKLDNSNSSAQASNIEVDGGSF